MEKFAVEIITPESIFLKDYVEMIVLPGVEGEFAILKNHVPFISELKPGFITIYEGNRIVKTFEVKGGFAEVTHDSCSIVTESITCVEP